MSTPYNDQWVLHRSGRGRRRRHAVEQLNRDGQPFPEQQIGGAAGDDGAAGDELAAAAQPPGRLAKRPKWIDRDT